MSLPTGPLPNTSRHDWRRWSATIMLEDEEFIIPAGEFVAVPQFSSRHRVHWSDGPRAVLEGAVELALREDGASASALWDRRLSLRLPRPLVLSLQVTLHGFVSAVPLWSGVLDELRLEDGLLILRGSAGIPGGSVRVCRDLGALPLSVPLPTGAWIPQLWGHHRAVRAMALFAPVRRSALRFECLREAKFLVLRDPVSWPASGTIQLNDEVLSYAVRVGNRQLGSETAPLLRPDPKDHRQDTPVWLLEGTGGFAWILCDHPSTVVQVFTGDDAQASPEVPVEVIVEDFHGRMATLLRSDRAPVLRTESTVPGRREPPIAYTNQWQLTTQSTADFGVNGFVDNPGFVGAVLSTMRPRLEANWIGNLGRSHLRFDRVLRAFLAFEFFANAGWPREATLRIDVIIADRVKSFSIHYNGYVERFQELLRIAEEDTAVPLRAESRTLRLIEMDSILEATGWTNAAVVLDRKFTDQFAESSATPAPSILRMSRHRPVEDGNHHARNLRLLVRMQGGAPFRIQAEAPGILKLSRTIPPAAGIRDEVLTVPVPPAVTLGELAAKLRVTLDTPEGGAVRIHECWCEVEVAELPAESRASTLDGGPLPMLYIPVELDFTELLVDGFPWDSFTPDSPRARVNIRLVNGEPSAPANVRRIRWSFEVQPAATVRMTTDLRARVSGRHTGPDGTAGPVAVLRDLLSEPEFLGEPRDLEQEQRDAAAAAIVAERATRFRAIVQDGRTVRQALSEALGECGAVLQREHWRSWIIALPTDWENRAAGELTAAHRIAPSGVEQMLLPSALPQLPAAIFATDHEAPTPLLGTDATGPLWTARWITAGITGITAFLRHWMAMPASRHDARVVPEILNMSPGTIIAMKGNASTAVVEGSSFRDGECTLLLRVLTDEELLWESSPWSIRRDPVRGRFTIRHRWNLIAAITPDGDIECAHGIRQDAEDEVPAAAAPIAADADSLTFMVATSSGRRGLRIHRLDPARIWGPVIENTEPDADPGSALEATTSQIIIRAGGTPVFLLNKHGLQLRAQLRPESITPP